MSLQSIESRVPDVAEALSPLDTITTNELLETGSKTLVTVGGIILKDPNLGLAQTNPERFHNYEPRTHQYAAYQQAA